MNEFEVTDIQGSQNEIMGHCGCGDSQIEIIDRITGFTLSGFHLGKSSSHGWREIVHG